MNKILPNSELAVCLCDTSSIQARIINFGPKVEKNLVKIPIVLGGNPYIASWS